MQTERLSDVEACELVLWFTVHADGNQGADKGEIGDYGRGLSFFYGIHGFKVKTSLKSEQKKEAVS